MAEKLQDDDRSGDDADEQAWIESPDGWGENEGQAEGYADLFGGDDPSQSFEFDINVDGGSSRTIRLRGFKLTATRRRGAPA